MPMLIPVVQGAIQGFRQLIQCFKPSTLEAQGSQLPPSWLNQVQPTGILGNKLNPNLRPCSQCKSGLATGMNAQIVLDDQPAVSGKLDWRWA